MAGDNKQKATELDPVPTILVWLLYSKKGAWGRINHGDFDETKHRRMTKSELAKIRAEESAGAIDDTPDPNATATGDETDEELEEVEEVAGAAGDDAKPTPRRRAASRSK